jgi:ABC-type antimicrobial peptide transport system permease subunit
MILKNLLRRKGRTMLTMFGIAIGVAAIIGLGALADGIEAGYGAMLGGSKADLVLSQTNAIDISLSSVPEEVEANLAAMPEVARTSGMIQGFIQTEDIPVFFVFGYPQDSFVLTRFNLKAGSALDSREADTARGNPLLLGINAAETMNKTVGDALNLGNTGYRVIGIYETGDTFEDSGAVIRMTDAQQLLGKPHQYSLIYIQLKDPALRDRLETRAERLWNDLEISGTEEFANKQQLGDYLKIYVWVIAGLAIILGGVGMMNSQLMAVMERTREIGVLRALGWRRRRVMAMILAETLLVSVLGAALGIIMGWGFIAGASDVAAIFGSTTANIRPYMIIQAFSVALVLGAFGGVYPAWQAARMAPVEALQYEGGGSGKRIRRLPVGGMALRGLMQRTSRTTLTLTAIALTVGTTLAMEGIVQGMTDTLGGQMSGGNAEIILRQAGVADTSLSAIDERVVAKIDSLPQVSAVSGLVLAVANVEGMPFFIAMGYAPQSLAIRRYIPVSGSPISGNRQVMLGRAAADALNQDVGDTMEINGSRFKVVGIFETGVGWEEIGGVISLRDAQIIAGRPRKVTILSVKVEDPLQAPAIVERINQDFPEVHAALTGEFVEQMPDMESMDVMLNAISILAVAVGGVSVMNTMLMAVLERTREIGVLRALGWKKRKILGMILNEATLLGLLGGAAGVLVAIGVGAAVSQIDLVEGALSPVWEWPAIARAISTAVILGILGGLYPALRATRLAPVEALRYE